MVEGQAQKTDKSRETQKSFHKTSPLRKPVWLRETKNSDCKTVTPFPRNWMLWPPLLHLPQSILSTYLITGSQFGVLVRYRWVSESQWCSKGFCWNYDAYRPWCDVFLSIKQQSCLQDYHLKIHFVFNFELLVTH